MKPKDSGPRVAGNRRPPSRIAPLPIEWMDPMSWRLPSGMALAEFALQAGFLAPLLLRNPNLKARKKIEPPELAGPVLSKQEEPASTGTFRETR